MTDKSCDKGWHEYRPATADDPHLAAEAKVVPDNVVEHVGSTRNSSLEMER